ncbi:MAG TPA: hypothetical protein VF121_16915 [Thermoanaerobaculia bacterium]|nr:hypothetical protein [Thermoanaerobaculia bacterium]
MDPNVASAAIGAVAAFVVAILTVILARLSDVRTEHKKIKNDYLSPLRLYVEEVHYRIEDMFRFPANRTLLAGPGTVEVSRQPAEWFNGHGCYFASSCYLTACLFAAMWRVRGGIPYLRLKRASDTELLTRILTVSHAFLDDLGIFYVIQHSIGEQMWDHAANRVITYRSFCEALQDPVRRVWFDRLLQFYMDVGKDGRLEQLRRAQKALEALSRLLDAGAAIEARKQAEQSRWKSGTPRPQLSAG